MSRSSASSPSRLLPVISGLLIGLIGVAIALTPHLLSGGLMPLQNMWIRETLPENMPFSLLPLNQYYLLRLVGVLAFAGTFAGCVSHFIFPVRRRSVALGAVLGVALGLVVALAQSFWVLAQGLSIAVSASSIAVIYFWGLLTGMICFSILALVATYVFAIGSPTPSAIWWALVAAPLTSWVTSWATIAGPIPGDSTWLGYISRFLPAIIVGLALAWYGVRPAARLLVWILDLALLFFIPITATAVQSAVGMRVLQGQVSEMLQYGIEVFRAQLTPNSPQLWVLGVALIIAIVGTVVRVRGSRRY
ncbi:hypothetical protein [Neomicrococcus lactis]|uniref:Uncharacterized protein with PQ loop repeat n=1 Tax=Neomicrococcus lactis TaxID=732241 RepID=A0A7W8YC05_9MICC|nr:hypothetical protein [Neomicrococcus lactis]MBB5598763.1 uncharacterized protein with PQ loop repeat [Neomicrococcus lactis]